MGETAAGRWGPAARGLVVVAPEMFASAAATLVAGLIEAAIATRGQCGIALCGGETPVPVYRELLGRVIDWSKVDFYFGDERAVPPEHPDSNYAAARRELFDHLTLHPEQVHRMAGERTDLDAAAWEYQQLLPPRFDILLLGIGLDGHTASIFPGSSAVAESRRRVVAVASPAAPIVPQVARLTITPLVIVAARAVVVMVQSTDKAAIVHRVLDGSFDPAALPAQLARNGTWVIDQAAAAQLQSRMN